MQAQLKHFFDVASPTDTELLPTVVDTVSSKQSPASALNTIFMERHLALTRFLDAARVRDSALQERFGTVSLVLCMALADGIARTCSVEWAPIRARNSGDVEEYELLMYECSMCTARFHEHAALTHSCNACEAVHFCSRRCQLADEAIHSHRSEVCALLVSVLKPHRDELRRLATSVRAKVGNNALMRNTWALQELFNAHTVATDVRLYRHESLLHVNDDNDPLAVNFNAQVARATIAQLDEHVPLLPPKLRRFFRWTLYRENTSERSKPQ
jgi:hypothetical protein